MTLDREGQAAAFKGFATDLTNAVRLLVGRAESQTIGFLDRRQEAWLDQQPPGTPRPPVPLPAFGVGRSDLPEPTTRQRLEAGGGHSVMRDRSIIHAAASPKAGVE